MTVVTSKGFSASHAIAALHSIGYTVEENVASLTTLANRSSELS